MDILNIKKKVLMIFISLLSIIVFSGHSKLSKKYPHSDNTVITHIFKSFGVLSFSANDLRKILKENPKCIGVAFKLKSKASIDLELLTVFEATSQGNSILSTKELDQPFNFKIERSVLPTENEAKIIKGSHTNLKFEFHDQLTKSGFSFSFSSRDELELILKNNPDRLYLSGAIIDFGTSGNVKGKHFTLKLETADRYLRNSGKGELNEIGKISFMVTIPCPPHWPQ